MSRYKRIFLFILDGCGCGEQPDYREYHSCRSNTLGDLFKTPVKFSLPKLESLGLSQLLGLGRNSDTAIHAKLQEISKGNDTFAGVWEMIGEPFLRRFATREKGFNLSKLRVLEKTMESKLVGNEYISGYKALDKYYAKHVELAAPIVYFSDDGVILFAGHTKIMSAIELNRLGAHLARLLKNSDYARVITRPFSGKPGAFKRIEKSRKDFIINKSTPKLFKSLSRHGISIRMTEHLHHLFGNPKDVSVLRSGQDNRDLMSSVIHDLRRERKGFFMYVFQDTDNYGHKKNITGFQKTLRGFDKWLGFFMREMLRTDLLMVTADHGCNPTLRKIRGHNREFVPLLVYSPRLQTGKNLGVRNTFADIGQTIAYNFKVHPTMRGAHFHEIF